MHFYMVLANFDSNSKSLMELLEKKIDQLVTASVYYKYAGYNNVKFFFESEQSLESLESKLQQVEFKCEIFCISQDQFESIKGSDLVEIVFTTTAIEISLLAPSIDDDQINDQDKEKFSLKKSILKLTETDNDTHLIQKERDIKINQNEYNLENLTGLSGIKNEVRTLINLIEFQKKRSENQLSNSSISYHLVFTGSPGTGKTTVARIIANIYKEHGILKQGHLIETDRSGLIAEYLGQTAIKVNKIVDSALDGILFIDEAYSIAGKNSDDYGKEAVATLIKRIEDDRDRLVVILAGYKDEMQEFIETNPGFKSRFNKYIHFEDYTPEELLEIFKKLCKKDSYTLHPDAKSKLFYLIKDTYDKRDRNFGNGRFVRNLFERTIANLANRVAKIENISKQELTEIKSEDISS